MKTKISIENLYEITKRKQEEFFVAQRESMLVLQILHRKIHQTTDFQNNLDCRLIEDDLYQVQLDVLAHGWQYATDENQRRMISHYVKRGDPLVTKILNHLEAETPFELKFLTFCRYNTFMEKMMQRTLTKKKYEGIMIGDLPYMFQFNNKTKPEYLPKVK